ncbi:MAG TPA: CoA ester lyase [Acidimicrobiales bacterium]
MRYAPRIRSALFVPAGREDFLTRAADRGADAVILDLEDSVSAAGKERAREAAGEWIAARGEAARPVVCVRVNALDDGVLAEDLEHVVQPALRAVLVPKIRHEDDVRAVAEELAYYEGRRGMPLGTVRIWPLVETVDAVQRAAAIASASPRVAYMGGGSSAGGDLARELNFEWSPDGLETLYVRSKVLVDVRAAGVPNPVSGLVTDIDDIDVVRQFAAQARRLGYEGMMVIHPSHVAIANEVFAATAEQLREARAILDALASAEREGVAAVVVDGRMVDTAMARSAAELLEREGR